MGSLKNAFSWARSVKRKARVYPVDLRFFKKTSTSNYLKDCYFRYRDIFVVGYIYAEKNNSLHKQFARYRHSRRFFSWFVEDVFAGAVRVVSENHEYTKTLTGKSKLRQLCECLYVSIFTPMMPENYYKFQIFKNIHFAGDYLNRYQMKSVIYRLVSPRDNCSSVSLSDKFLFSQYATQHGIPTPNVIAIADSNQITLQDNFRYLPDEIFIKPRFGKGGSGAIRLQKMKNCNQTTGFLRRKTGDFIKESDLEEFLKSKAIEEKDTLLIQEVIAPHDSLHDLVGEVAATVRIVTVLNEDNLPEVTSAHFRIPAFMDSEVDNTHAGGYAAAVDIRTGCIGKLSNYGTNGDSIFSSIHPVNGANVEGRKLPFWEKTLELVRTAHAEISERTLIGWDICITNSGPVVIEANCQPCTDSIQRRAERPLGSARLGELLAFHVRCNEHYFEERLSKLDSKFATNRWWLLGFDKIKVMVVVRGKVTGVGFRDWLRNVARAHDIRGIVCNNPDGEVEAVFYGRSRNINRALRLCWIGPTRAVVESIEVAQYKGSREAYKARFRCLSQEEFLSMSYRNPKPTG